MSIKGDQDRGSCLIHFHRLEAVKDEKAKFEAEMGIRVTLSAFLDMLIFEALEARKKGCKDERQGID